MFPTKLLKLMLVIAVLSLAVYAVFRWKRPNPFKEAKEYNILLISLDTARADHFSCYGNSSVSTPNVNRLAKEGVLFKHFYSTINTTLAAHCSMFTGLYPRNHGVGRNSMRLNESLETLPEILSSHGYQTAAFVGSFALASVFGINQGFGVYEESFVPDAADYVSQEVKVSTLKKGQFENLVLKKKVGEISRNAESVNQVFFKWLEKNDGKKFFAMVHYYDPHFPYHPPETWLKERAIAIPPETPLTQMERQKVSFRDLVPFEGTEYPELINTLMKLYTAEIEYCDFAIGQILERLNQLKLRSKTIILLTADHGETLVEHQEFNSFFQHGSLTFHTETHVPLIISAPGLFPAGRTITQLASQVDIVPSLLNLLGLNPPSPVDGISLLDAIQFPDKVRERKIFTEASQPRVRLQRDAPKMVWVNDLNSGTAHWGPYEYITIPYLQHEALYNTSEDPTEQRNLFHQFSLKKPELVAAFRESMEKWRKESKRPTSDKLFHLSEEAKEKLKSLGYVQ